MPGAPPPGIDQHGGGTGAEHLHEVHHREAFVHIAEQPRKAVRVGSIRCGRWCSA